MTGLTTTRAYVTVASVVQNFGEQLTHVMEHLNVSVGELARRMGKDTSEIRKWRSGRVAWPRTPTLEKIADALGIELAQLLGMRKLPRRPKTVSGPDAGVGAPLEDLPSPGQGGRRREGGAA